MRHNDYTMTYTDKNTGETVSVWNPGFQWTLKKAKALAAIHGTVTVTNNDTKKVNTVKAEA